MADFLETYVGFFNDPLTALLAISLGYFICRFYKKDFMGKEGEFDKLIFSAITGLGMYIYLLIISASTYTFLHGFFMVNSPDTIYTWARMALTESLIVLCAYWFFEEKISALFEGKNEKKFWITISIFFVFSLCIGLVFTIFSYFSIFRETFSESMSGIMVLLFFLSPFLIKSGNILKHSLQRTSIKEMILTTFIAGILILSIAIFAFPSVEPLNDIEITSHEIVLSQYSLSPQHINENVKQTVIIKKGWLSTVFVKNEWNILDMNESSRLNNLKTQLGSNIKNISYDETHEGLVLKFNGFNRETFEINISGYRKSNLSLDLFRIKRTSNNDYFVNLFITNNLDKEIRYDKGVRLSINDLSSTSCLIRSDFIKITNIKSTEALEPLMKNLDEDIILDIYINSTNERILALQNIERATYLTFLTMPAQTNITLSFIVFCN